MGTNVVCVAQHFIADMVLLCRSSLLEFIIRAGPARVMLQELKRHQFTFNNMQGSPNPSPPTSSVQRMAVNMQPMNL